MDEDDDLEDFKNLKEVNKFLKQIPQLLYIKPNYVPELLDTEFFIDEKRRIDYILAYTNFNEDPENLKQRDLFIENLKKMKIQNETIQTVLPGLNLFFIKLHVPNDIIEDWAESIHIPLRRSKPDILPEKLPKYYGKLIATKLIYQLDPNEEFIMNRNKNEITTAERSMIIKKILDHIPFGTTISEIGINRALYYNIFIDAYPLHEKIYVSANKTGDENSWTMYQLLGKYWASYKQILKEQPLNALEQYFGPEVAMFYAWRKLYNYWLFFMAIGGVITHILGNLFFYFYRYRFGEEVCTSTKLLCPYCINPQYCSFMHLRDWCEYSKMSHKYDNFFQGIFSIIMLLSGGILTAKWNQNLVILNHNWGLDDTQVDKELRIDFENRAELKVSKKTGKVKFTLPKKEKVLRYTISYSITLMIIVAIVTACSALVIYKIYCRAYFARLKSAQIRQDYQMVVLVSSSTLNLLSIVPMQVIYDKLAHKITEIECPRTQTEFDRAFLFKRFAFTFLNYFAPLFHLAFFKGLFHTNPGDKRIQNSVILTNQCPPTGCFVELYIQLAITIVGRQILSLFQKLIMPFLRIWWNSLNLNLIYLNQLPRWEQDYRLKYYHRYTLALELQEYVIQYAMVTLFVAIFPLGALIAFVFNLIEMRVTAKRLLLELQRPVAKRICDLGIFEFIIKCVTYIAIGTNAFAIAITSDFIIRWYYILLVKKEFLNIGLKEFSLSRFKIEDYGTTTLPPLPSGYTNQTECLYVGFRLPPTHPRKYQTDTLYWYIRTIELLFIVFYEHFVLSARTFILYHMPKIPPKLAEKIDQENITKHKKMLHDMKTRRNPLLLERNI